MSGALNAGVQPARAGGGRRFIRTANGEARRVDNGVAHRVKLLFVELHADLDREIFPRLSPEFPVLSGGLGLTPAQAQAGHG
jgi:hypothetical protein